jgi:hypothetical protein
MTRMRAKGYMAKSRKEMLDEAYAAQYHSARLSRRILAIKKAGGSGAVSIHECGHYGSYPSALVRARKKFARLRDAWKAGRGHHSDTVTLVMHPAYQSIVGMGPVAIPFLLRELAASPDRWYWALRAITEEDPVPVEARGNSKMMAQAWLEWGKERGYQW